MSEVLRRNPETGEIEREVVSYERVELAHYQDRVGAAESALEAKRNEIVERAFAEHSDELAPLEAELEDAKSGFEAYQAVAGSEQGGDDTPTEAVAPQGEGEVAGEPVPVNVETPEADQF